MVENEDFPIKTDTACQLKWSHSTIFLTKNTTSSCHRVVQHPIQDNFDFHNNPEKIIAREKMLKGEWPGLGCEHCKVIEDAGGFSDRMMHLNFPGLGPPPELQSDPFATNVTPRWVEVYFSNLCQMSCVYCSSELSSSWFNENLKFGKNLMSGRPVTSTSKNNTHAINANENAKKFFQWLDSNIHHLYNLLVLGGEPFTQPQTDELLDFLQTKKCPNLTLTLFSNLSIDYERMIKRFQKIEKLIQNKNIKQVHIVGSLDNWGKQAEYARFGLKLDLFEKNFEYLLNNTSCTLGINSAWTSLTTNTYPDLIEKINKWNGIRRVYHSLMQVDDPSFLHPKVFGPWILDQGMYRAHESFETHNDPELTNYKEYFAGIIKSIEKTTENKVLQHSMHAYLTELDRRRNTDYTKLYPELYEKIHE